MKQIIFFHSLIKNKKIITAIQPFSLASPSPLCQPCPVCQSSYLTNIKILIYFIPIFTNYKILLGVPFIHNHASACLTHCPPIQNPLAPGNSDS